MLEQPQFEILPFADDPTVVARLKYKRDKRITYWLLIFVPVFTYLIKYSLFSIGNQGTLGILAIFCLPVAVLPIVVSCELWFIVYGIWCGDALPVLAAIPLFLLAAYLPLLPLIPNDSQRHFSAHRAEYELIARQANAGFLFADISFRAHIERRKPLVVMFNPEGYNYTYIVYAKQRSDLYRIAACDYDGSIADQLDETWWLCFRDWN